MTLTDRERAMARFFGEARRRYERWTSILIFTVGLVSGLIGAYSGVKNVLIIFGSMAFVLALRFAFMLAQHVLR